MTIENIINEVKAYNHLSRGAGLGTRARLAVRVGRREACNNPEGLSPINWEAGSPWYYSPLSVEELALAWAQELPAGVADAILASEFIRPDGQAENIQAAGATWAVEASVYRPVQH